MQAFGLISLLIAVALGVLFLVRNQVDIVNPDSQLSTERAVDPSVINQLESKADLIMVTSPEPGGLVSNPISITGKARGHWYFEGSFPVVLTDWDGKIIAEHYATADGEWMTTDFVPFTSSLTFQNPYRVGDPEYMRHGTLILRKSNPSGMPAHDDSLEIPVLFNASVSPTQDISSYKDAIDAAHGAVGSIERKF